MVIKQQLWINFIFFKEIKERETYLQFDWSTDEYLTIKFLLWIKTKSDFFYTSVYSNEREWQLRKETLNERQAADDTSRWFSLARRAGF